MYQFSNVHKDEQANLCATLHPGILVVVPYSFVSMFLSAQEYSYATDEELIAVLSDWVFQFDVA